MNKMDKERVAEAVLSEIKPNIVLGMGTGSTVDSLIEKLPGISLPSQIVSSSKRTTQGLKSVGIETVSLQDVSKIDVYIDGADEVNENKVAIKGRGGAHTLEKILAVNASLFVGIVTEEKYTNLLRAPIPVEVLPEARSYVAKQLLAFGEPKLREEKTDRGNDILDLLQWKYQDLDMLEEKIKIIPGVIETGLFSKRRFDKVYIAKPQTIEII